MFPNQEMSVLLFVSLTLPDFALGEVTSGGCVYLDSGFCSMVPRLFGCHEASKPEGPSTGTERYLQ